jgi:NAD+ kinase
MRIGITGNTNKSGLWTPVASCIRFLLESGITFKLNERIAEGLKDRGVFDSDFCSRYSNADFADSVDMVLSFGGDGTLLNTVHELNGSSTPILGVNIGRLGFLAPVEDAHLNRTIELIESGDYEVEERMVLEARIPGRKEAGPVWALNEFTVQGSGTTGLLAIEVRVNDTLLNTYWADGLIVSSPTGSTAYSLAAGGPIISPDCNTILVTAIAPHTLSVRPVVLPEQSVLDIRVLDQEKSSTFSFDGKTSNMGNHGETIRIRKAQHSVRLIRPHGQNYFETLRAKLMWGIRKT